MRGTGLEYGSGVEASSMSLQISQHLANQLTEDDNQLRPSLISGLRHPILCLHLLKVLPVQNSWDFRLLFNPQDQERKTLRETRDPGGSLSSFQSVRPEMAPLLASPH